MAVETHRQQLTEFLKSCRARLSPADMGLPDPNRRRTPGLRREDVAALAGVSVTWYTWLEQGRQIKVSAEVLERICTTLRLSPDEREYLFALVQHRPAPPLPRPMEGVSPTLLRLIDALAVPAIVKTARWDVLAWNELAKVFRDYDALPPNRRNLLKLLLVDDPVYRHDPVAYETMARRVLAKFRVDYSQVPNDPAFEELIADLEQSSEIFRRLWNSPEVVGRSEAVVYHPQLGGLVLEHSSYVPEGYPMLRLVLFVPYDQATADKIANLHELNRQRKAKKPERRPAKSN
ncbi:MAG TPA: helix-turn-helix transcriptional regulator [Gammaproteobacteria bacterium]